MGQQDAGRGRDVDRCCRSQQEEAGIDMKEGMRVAQGRKGRAGRGAEQRSLLLPSSVPPLPSQIRAASLVLTRPHSLSVVGGPTGHPLQPGAYPGI